jgi:hypothetical protein
VRGYGKCGFLKTDFILKYLVTYIEGLSYLVHSSRGSQISNKEEAMLEYLLSC